MPDFWAHFPGRKRVAVAMALVVGHDGSVFGVGGRAVGVPDKVEDAFVGGPWNGASMDS